MTTFRALHDVEVEEKAEVVVVVEQGKAEKAIILNDLRALSPPQTSR